MIRISSSLLACWCLPPIAYLLIIWCVYLATRKFLFSRKLIWVHVIFAIVLPWFIFAFPYLIHTNLLSGDRPRRYYDFNEWNYYPFRSALPSYLFRIFFLLLLLGQLILPINLVMRLFKFINRQSVLLLYMLVYLTNCSPAVSDAEIKSGRNQDQILDSTWKGTWTRYMWQETAILEITAINKDSFVFDIEVGSGGRVGDFSGTAGISGDSALFLATEDDDSCLYRFKRLGDSVILVERIKGECGGTHVLFDGRYVHQKYFKEIEENLVTLSIMKTAAQDVVFQNLVGEDYQNFVNTTHLLSLEDDLDSSGATVMVSGVRSLFTSMEYIIMTDSSGQKFSAAIIDDDDVNYYTNWERFKGVEPQTIKFWRSRFVEKRFVLKQ